MRACAARCCALVLAVVSISSSAFGFTHPSSVASAHYSKKHSIGQQPISALSMARSHDSSVTRSDFLFVSTSILGSLAALAPHGANAFEGGVGGLGKTRPQTGVVFRDPEAAAVTSQSKSGDVNYELVAPDGTPVFLSFSAPWPLLKSSAGIEARDISGGESSYVQIVELPKGVNSLDNVKPALFSENVFGSAGKFGMYGVPTDVKIKKISQTTGAAIYQASFTTLTPAMRESDRKAYISAAVVGNGLFLLVTTTSSVRFGKLEGALRKVADSFSAISAPKSNLNQRKLSP